MGLSGKDGMLLEARKLAMTISHGEQQPPEIIDLGNVGEVTAVNVQLLRSLIKDEFVPVIAPVGVDSEGNTYNINADSVPEPWPARSRARRLLMLTDVAGILDKEGKLIEHIDTADAHRLLEDGTLSGGMIPKITAASTRWPGAWTGDHRGRPRVENCLLLELLTDQGIGTEIVK